jgi:hypothetical protein
LCEAALGRFGVFFGTSVDDHRGARFGQAARDGEADSGRRTGDDGALSA